MATPIAHTMAGYLVFSASASSVSQKRWLLLGFCLVLAIAPDFDFLPVSCWASRRLSPGISHSLGLAVLASLALASVYNLKQRLLVAAWWRFSRLCVPSGN
jgi:hypothetical protein